MLCLQNALVSTYNNDKATCSEIENTAFDSHARCYVDSGICNIPLDWKTIFQVVGIQDLGGMKIVQGIQQIIQTVAGCASFTKWFSSCVGCLGNCWTTYQTCWNNCNGNAQAYCEYLEARKLFKAKAKYLLVLFELLQFVSEESDYKNAFVTYDKIKDE
ncbi:9428_t:CDS:2, partial [Dentiscutata heterogama]